MDRRNGDISKRFLNGKYSFSARSHHGVNQNFVERRMNVLGGKCEIDDFMITRERNLTDTICLETSH